MWEIQADCNFLNFGVWRSLVSRLVRDQEAMGSSPVTPTSREPRHAIHAVEVLLFLGFFLRFKSVMNTSYFLSILLKKCSCSLIKVLDTAVLFCYNTCCLRGVWFSRTGSSPVSRTKKHCGLQCFFLPKNRVFRCVLLFV